MGIHTVRLQFTLLITCLALYRSAETCSNIFVLSPDRSRGSFELAANIGDQITTSIEIAVSRSLFNKNDGELTLTDTPNEAQRRLQGYGTVRYTFIFPPTNAVMKVIKISQNDERLCFQDAGKGDWGSVVKYSHVMHSLARPLRSSDKIYFPTDESTTASPVLTNLPTPKWSDPTQNLSIVCGLTNSNTAPSAQFDIKEWPWILSIRHLGKSDFHCTGTLVTFRTIVSAAHCYRTVDSREDPGQILVLLGTTKANRSISANVRLGPVFDIFYYPEYKPDTLEHDVALVILHKPFIVSGSMRPACIWPIERQRQNSATGYVGAYYNINGALPSANIVEVALSNTGKCGDKNVASNELCVENTDNSHLCTEDSGTGLVTRRNGRWFLLGVLSGVNFRRTSCIWNHTIYSDINFYTPWIRETVFGQYNYDLAN